MLMRFLFCLVAVMLSASVTAGTIHKWVDEDGNVHYGDAPPVKAKTESVRVQSAPSNPGRSLPRLNNQNSEAAGSSSTAGAGADTAANKVPADQAKLACDQAREDLQVINRSSRIKLRTTDGGERYLSTEEIAERKSQAEADVKQFCN